MHRIYARDGTSFYIFKILNSYLKNLKKFFFILLKKFTTLGVYPYKLSTSDFNFCLMA
jgi:hypothetical protein